MRAIFLGCAYRRQLKTAERFGVKVHGQCMEMVDLIGVLKVFMHSEDRIDFSFIEEGRSGPTGCTMDAFKNRKK
jgi:hypothetical protein